jgi:type II secretory ATPase GspE/PulE/Tfp pilus assembly ATPase PilB-like protein
VVFLPIPSLEILIFGAPGASQSVATQVGKILMVPSPSNPGQLKSPSSETPSIQVSDSFGFQTDQMFRLIDSILPFEACLYYQFLPVGLEGKYLRLAMVAPQDSSALDYVRRILAYLNCSLKTEQISPEAHQSLLSAYLNHTHRSESLRQQVAEEQKQATQSESTTEIGHEVQAPESKPDVHTEQQAILIQPSEPVFNNSNSSSNSTRTSDLAIEVPLEASSATALTSVRKLSLSDEAVPPLEVRAIHLTRSMEYIATLAPPQLLQELLGRVLLGGIGRLYFERQSEQGRILWSQDGVLQSVLEGIALSVFQGLIIELKRIFNLPLLPVVQPKQVEIERRHQQECLLLRLRVMPGTYGEEATLQVLRGVALKFYQRQQLEKLSQDALRLAQQLQRKLYEIRDRSYRCPLPLETLPALNQQLRGLDQQLEAIAQLQMYQDSDP